jgi:ribonuclease HI
MPFRSYPRKKTSSPSLFPDPIPPGRPDHYLLAHVDGGARGNPGPAGYGVVIEDEKGTSVAQLSEYLGHQTNNFAEYSGLLAALRYAVDHGPRALEVIADSELMVKQMNGQYKVRAPQLIDLYQQARALVRQLDWFRIRHVRRAHNSAADKLANRAMDQASGPKA